MRQSISMAECDEHFAGSTQRQRDTGLGILESGVGGRNSAR